MEDDTMVVHHSIKEIHENDIPESSQGDGLSITKRPSHNQNATNTETQNNQLRRTTRTHRPPERLNLLVETHNEIYIPDDDEHITYSEAMLDTDSQRWQEAMKSEMD